MSELKAMISSTALDLPEHREQAKKACLKCKALPIGMEELPAQDASGIRASLDMVDEADIYIGIYAHRYGWIPDGHDISITELEFNRAVERGIPILVFLIHKDHFIIADMMETGDIPQKKLKAFKTRAADGRVKVEFKSAVELHGQIVHALGELKAQYQAHKGRELSESPQSALHQLPPVVADFVGREKELADLKTKIQSGGAMISGIQGMGGIGKTQLALKLAHDLVSHYPDAQFYLDLRGADPEQRAPVTSAEAMRHVLLSIDRGRSLPEREEELRAMYLSELNGRRAILLMDNAFDAAQVKPLIPPNGCLLLVTSRRHFTLPGIATVDLNVMPKDKARELLLSIRSAIGDHADRIAEHCAYLPLALRIAGEYLNDSAGMGVEEYIEELRANRLKKLDGVEATIQISVRGLNEQETSCLHALSVFPATFDRAAAAAICTMSDTEVRDILAHLVKLSLLQWNEETKRYHMHDLVRLVADQSLNDDTRQQLHVRHAEHYRAVAKQTSELYQKGSEHTMQGLALFDLEWGNIHAAFDWAQANLGTNDSATRLSAEIPDAGLYCLHLRQHPQDRIRWLEMAAKACHLQNNDGGEAAQLGNLGLIYRRGGNLDRAEEMHYKALTIDEKLGRFEAMANHYSNLGVIYGIRGDVDGAEQMFNKSLAIDEKLGRLEGMAADYGNLGLIYRMGGNLDRAEEMHNKSLTINEKLGRLEGMADQYGNLGLLYQDRGELDRSEQMHKKSLAIEEKLGRLEGIATEYANLGSTYKIGGDVKKARECWTKARDLFGKIGMPHMVKNIQSRLDALPPE